MLPLQVEFVGGGVLPVLVAFLVGTLFSAVALHLAALWILGEEPHQRAAKAAPVPVGIAMLFSQYSAALMLGLSFAGALAAVRYVYELTTFGALAVTVFYFAITTMLAFTFWSLFLV
jgi:hypothetical protein